MERKKSSDMLQSFPSSGRASPSPSPRPVAAYRSVSHSHSGTPHPHLNPHPHTHTHQQPEVHEDDYPDRRPPFPPRDQSSFPTVPIPIPPIPQSGGGDETTVLNGRVYHSQSVRERKNTHRHAIVDQFGRTLNEHLHGQGYGKAKAKAQTVSKAQNRPGVEDLEELSPNALLYPTTWPPRSPAPGQRTRTKSSAPALSLSPSNTNLAPGGGGRNRSVSRSRLESIVRPATASGIRSRSGSGSVNGNGRSRSGSASSHTDQRIGEQYKGLSDREAMKKVKDILADKQPQHVMVDGKVQLAWCIPGMSLLLSIL